MATIYYIARKDGMAGFIKLVETSSCEDGELFLHGPEIHFRRQAVKARNDFTNASTSADIKSPDLHLALKNRKLRASLVNYKKIITANNDDASKLWERLVSNAKEINKRENSLDTDQYTTCCHTLAFETLEATGLTAPREEFTTELERRKIIARTYVA